ncbi:MAG: oxaloacetate decarboxylase [Armatimonadota bacterium]|nr:oxaloacetate decarboxylase [Armatimonadota bacterium]
MTSPEPTTPARRLRRRLSDPRLVVAPGVFDGLSARIATAAGFEALYASGGAIARSAGVPDLGLLSVTEVLGRLREIVDATDLPVIADADTGYGNALNVYRTVREFERLGVAALHLEDQVSPKKCGHYAGKSLIPAEEMVGKLKAAQDARRNPDLVIIARTDARAVEGLDGAIRRGNLYAAAGADLVFVEAPESEDELRTIAQAVRAPLLVNMFWGGRTPLVSPEALAAMGYRVMIVPGDLQRAAIRAMQDAADAIRRTGTAAGLGERLAGFDERDALVDLAFWQRLEERYAAAERAAGGGGPAAGRAGGGAG